MPIRLTVAALLLATAVAGACLGYSFVAQLVVRHSLHQQPLTVTFPPEMNTRTTVTNTLDIGLNGFINAQVPLKQQVDLPLRGRYDAVFEIDTVIPLDFEVIYEGVVPVDVMATLNMDLDFDFQRVKKYTGIPVEAQVPIKMNLPVSIRAPVRHELPFRYKGPIAIEVDEILHPQLNEMLHTRIAVDQTVTSPVTASFGMAIQTRQEPIRAVIEKADLRIRPATLALDLAYEPDFKLRQDSAFGKAGDPPAKD